VKRVLITGGTGFVGANLVRRLLRDGHEIHLVVREGRNLWRVEDVRGEVTMHVADLVDTDGLQRVIRAVRPEWVFHLAVYGAYSDQRDLDRMVRTNLTGTMNLLNACLASGFEVLVNTGSSSEYGFKDHAASEGDALDPNSEYGVTKASATMYCRHVARSRNVRLPTLRLYSVYGPFEEPTRLLPTVIMRGLGGRLPDLVNPRVARDFVFVEDVVEAYVLAASVAQSTVGPVYNVGTGIQTTLAQVVDFARRTLGIVEEPRWGTMPGRVWDTEIWVADNRKALGDLGWKPLYGFEHGFRRFVEWFQARPDFRRHYEMLVP
jgi:UDP-glucose 4-epimerase